MRSSVSCNVAVNLASRHGATSVGDFRDEGFLPDAMVSGFIFTSLSAAHDLATACYVLLIQGSILPC